MVIRFIKGIISCGYGFLMIYGNHIHTNVFYAHLNSQYTHSVFGFHSLRKS